MSHRVKRRQVMVHSRCAAVDVQIALEIVSQGVKDNKERCAAMISHSGPRRPHAPRREKILSYVLTAIGWQHHVKLRYRGKDGKKASSKVFFVFFVCFSYQDSRAAVAPT